MRSIKEIIRGIISENRLILSSLMALASFFVIRDISNINKIEDFLKNRTMTSMMSIEAKKYLEDVIQQYRFTSSNVSSIPKLKEGFKQDIKRMFKRQKVSNELKIIVEVQDDLKSLSNLINNNEKEKAINLIITIKGKLSKRFILINAECINSLKSQLDSLRVELYKQ